MIQPEKGPMTQSEIDLIEKLKAAEDSARAKEETKFVPKPRVRQPWQGWANWEKHKEKQAARRKAGNRRARQTRKAQRRAS